MPRNAADLEEALNKKGGLTLSQLANYDDLITDALVDRVYYWSTIRKLKGNYHACRGVQEELVCKFLQDHVVIEKDAIAAHKKLLALPGITKYYKSLHSEDEKEHFERHLRKYISIYLPDCPFEVDTTNRYTITTAEACIKARKTIKKGEQIKYLSGIQVEMTEKEEKELSNRTDFSIVLSSRRKRPSLFLGPARFANHDCDSNARLNTTGPHGIHIVARKDIEPGDEITVTYGEDYFGIDNCECLCATCEGLMRNGWDPRGPPLEDSSDEEEEEDDDEEEVVELRKTISASTDESERSFSNMLGKRKRGVEMAPAVRTAGSIAKRHCGGLGQAQHTADEDLEESIETGSSFFGRHGRSISREQCQGPPRDHLLERIFNLLTSIGERRERESASRKASPNTADQGQSMAGAETSLEAPDKVPVESFEQLPETIDVFGRRNGVSSSASPPTYARGLSRSPTLESSPQKLAQSSNKNSTLDVPKSKLPSARKERSFSSLRNVTNAEDTVSDIYSIPVSPAPPEAPKRKRGRPPKNRPVTDASGSSGSSSPDSSNNDSSSATSQTSSMTSMGSFAAGTIASSICQMLTTENDQTKEGDPGQAAVIQDAANSTDAMDIDDDTAEQASSALSRGRQQTRRSPRKAAPDISVPPVESIERSALDESDDSEEEQRGPVRTPGDYTLCKALLATPYHRWVECRNCDEHFVQGDAYLTRIACPRCERHSKLYGYYWPKTDKEGKFDTEERVLDHRTIHRFIEPDEERSERKGRKTLADVVKERELSSRQESEESDGVEKRLRNSPSRRKLRNTM